MSSIVIQTPPAAEPVTLATLKNHLRVTLSDDDELLKIYLQAAREVVESASGRSLVNKVYRQSHDRFPHRHEGSGFGAAGYFYSAPRYAHHRGDERQAIKLLRCPLVQAAKITYIGLDQLPHDLLPVPEIWRAKAEYDIGAQITDGSNLQEVTALTEAETGGASLSGAAAPAWNAVLGGVTTDADLTWTNKGAAPAGDFLMDRDSEPPRLLPLSGQVWPVALHVPNAVQVFFTAGYGKDAADAPATLKVAVLQTVGVSYEFREAATLDVIRDLAWYERLIWSQRVVDFSPTP